MLYVGHLNLSQMFCISCSSNIFVRVISISKIPAICKYNSSFYHFIALCVFLFQIFPKLVTNLITKLFKWRLTAAVKRENNKYREL